MPTIQDVWKIAVERVKHNVTAPNVFRALDRVVPIAWEDGVFVAGLSAIDGAMASVLTADEYRRAIEQNLRAASGDLTLKFRLIEGTTVDDWSHAKARDAALVARAAQQAERKTFDPGAITTWDGLYDQLNALWTETPYRTMASGKGRFLSSAFDLIDIGLATLGEPSEATERAFSRVLERLASMTGSDPAVLAYLLFQRRTKR